MLGLDTALGPVAEWDAGHILLRASLDTGVFVRQRRVGWRVAIALPEGLHIYGSPVQDGFVSVGIDVSVPEGVVVDGPRYPAPEYASFPFVDGAVPVYHGVFEVTGGVTFADIREDVEVGVTVRYQACSDTECFAPAVARVSLPIRYEAFG
ncbi:MAG TPA: protein-disulfide reductase DsbD domain-containing protein [Thermomicrobiales bacterium]|nr:protein-disulfide reductase DsbD domain-containing protein [Thermomicrobiales bacterium]